MMHTTAEILRGIVKHPVNSGYVAKVETVNGRVCDVLPLDGAPLTNVRLNTNIADTVGILITPVTGSFVVVSRLSEWDSYVSLFSEIEKIEITIGETSVLIQEDKAELVMGNTHITIVDGELEMNIGEAVMKVSGNKFAMSNQTYSLKNSLNELIQELNAAIITTPAGPGSVAPSTQLKLTAINNKVNQLMA